jgi:hypothetical protein
MEVTCSLLKSRLRRFSASLAKGVTFAATVSLLKSRSRRFSASLAKDVTFAARVTGD